ncbi:MAG: zinc-ribbon domain-containing protein [Nitrospirales bacterium]
MKICPACKHQLPEISRFCTQCGTALDALSPHRPARHEADEPTRPQEEMNVRVLYLMVALLVLALLVPPWETPPEEPPAFLGFSFILSPPAPEARVSRILLTIEVFTITVAGLYFAWLWRTGRRE